MKKWITVIVVVIIVGVIVYLVKEGILSWQTISILAAAVAAPFKFIAGLFSTKDEEQEIISRHEEVRAAEAAYRAGVAERILEKEQNIVRLQQEVELIDQRLEDLRRKRERISKEVDAMSLRQLQKEGQKYLGD